MRPFGPGQQYIHLAPNRSQGKSRWLGIHFRHSFVLSQQELLAAGRVCVREKEIRRRIEKEKIKIVATKEGNLDGLQRRWAAGEKSQTTLSILLFRKVDENAPSFLLKAPPRRPLQCAQYIREQKTPEVLDPQRCPISNVCTCCRSLYTARSKCGALLMGQRSISLGRRG